MRFRYHTPLCVLLWLATLGLSNLAPYTGSVIQKREETQEGTPCEIFEFWSSKLFPHLKADERPRKTIRMSRIYWFAAEIPLDKKYLEHVLYYHGFYTYSLYVAALYEASLQESDGQTPPVHYALVEVSWKDYESPMERLNIFACCASGPRKPCFRKPKLQVHYWDIIPYDPERAESSIRGKWTIAQRAGREMPRALYDPTNQTASAPINYRYITSSEVWRRHHISRNLARSTNIYLGSVEERAWHTHSSVEYIHFAIEQLHNLNSVGANEW